MSAPHGDSVAGSPNGAGASGTLFDPDGAAAAQSRSAPGGAAVPPPTRPRRRAAPLVVGAAVALLGVGAAVLVAGSAGPPPPPPTFDLALRTEPIDARIDLDGEFVSLGVVLRRLPRDGRPHTLRVTADGHVTRTITFVDACPGDLVTLDALPTAAAPSVRHPRPSATGMEGARSCMNSGREQAEVNRCIVGALEGNASTEPEIRLLCVTYRQMGDRRSAARCMRSYLSRFPSTRYTDQFNEYVQGQ